MKPRTLGLLVSALTIVLFLPLCIRIDEQKSVVQSFPDSSPRVNPVAEEEKASIIMYSRDGCPPCDRWQAECESALKAAGWNVVVTKNGFNGPTPTFVVTIKGKKYSKTGYASKSKFYAWLRSLSEETKTSAEPAATKPCVGQSCKPSRRVFGRPNLIRRRR